MIFRSIRFNVVLFLVIALLAALGTLIPQITDNADKVSAFLNHHPLWGGFLNGCGFFDIYHTSLFAALLALMAFDVVVCKLWNKPPDHGLIPLPEDQTSEEDHPTLQALRKKPLQLQGRLTGAPEEAARQLSQLFKSNRYTLKKIDLPEGIALVASRHRLQRWGSYVSHISLVIILLGAMMKSLLGFETFLPILEGHAANVTEPVYATLPKQSLKNALVRRRLDPIAHWELWVDKMTVDFYRHSTTPSTFASKVRLYDDGRMIRDATIRVNQPLDVNHIRFYQASWGVTGMVRGALLHVGDKTLDLGMKESFPIPGQPWTGRIEHYLPDFVIGAHGEPSTASLEWKNPALVIGFYNKKHVQIGTLVLGAPSPAVNPAQEPWALFFVADGHIPVRPPFDVLSVQPLLFSGIQVSYDPGFPVIVVGVLSMILGLAVLFYLHQRRVLVFLRQEGAKVKIDIGAWSSRGVPEFEAEFQSLFLALHLQPATEEAR